MENLTHKQAALDLLGVKTLTNVIRNHNIRALQTLPIAVVDYRGHRLVAQSIVPGFMEASRSLDVVYGSLDYRQTYGAEKVSNAAAAAADDTAAASEEAKEKKQTATEAIAVIARTLHLAPHEVADAAGTPHKFTLPSECKAVVGTDGRTYIFDLVHISPRDMNYEASDTALLRPEFVSIYSTHKMNERLRVRFPLSLSLCRSCCRLSACCICCTRLSPGFVTSCSVLGTLTDVLTFVFSIESGSGLAGRPCARRPFAPPAGHAGKARSDFY